MAAIKRKGNSLCDELKKAARKKKSVCLEEGRLEPGRRADVECQVDTKGTVQTVQMSKQSSLKMDSSGGTSRWRRLRHQTSQIGGEWEAKAGKGDGVTKGETEEGKHDIFFR